MPYSVTLSIRLSVCLSHAHRSKTENHVQRSNLEERRVIYVRSNWLSNSEVKRLKIMIKVTVGRKCENIFGAYLRKIYGFT